MDASTIRGTDRLGMLAAYDAWPKIAAESYESDMPPIDADGASHVIFAGMGGSGTIGDVFSAVLSKTPIHVDVVKGYQLPRTANRDTVVIATSMSGNTEETLSVLAEAARLRCKAAAFSCGGAMESFCAKNGIQHAGVSTTHSSRASFPAFAFSILRALEPLLPVRRSDVAGLLKNLGRTAEGASSSRPGDANPAVRLAGWMTGIPVIYYPRGLQAAATRFKNSLQENAKMHATTEDIIEACHNGVVSWCRASAAVPILIRGADDHRKTKERWAILKEFFTERGIDYREVRSVDGCILDKLVNLIYFLDYASIYRAILSGTDPTPVEPIDFVKRRLAMNG